MGKLFRRRAKMRRNDRAIYNQFHYEKRFYPEFCRALLKFHASQATRFGPVKRSLRGWNMPQIEMKNERGGAMIIREIIGELKSHAPFTALGTVSGILIILFISVANVPRGISETLFWTLHPLHVLLSALVTTALYKLHTCPRIGIKCVKGQCNFWALTLIGYMGSVGIATLSDSLIPYVAEFLLKMPHRGIHLGFIEKWWLVNPLALLGIVIGYLWPRTHFTHMGHVFLSTWASVLHIAMAMSAPLNLLSAAVIIVFLFLAVWIPCCVSDIVFPLLFANNPKKWSFRE